MVAITSKLLYQSDPTGSLTEELNFTFSYSGCKHGTVDHSKNQLQVQESS